VRIVCQDCGSNQNAYGTLHRLRTPLWQNSTPLISQSSAAFIQSKYRPVTCCLFAHGLFGGPTEPHRPYTPAPLDTNKEYRLVGGALKEKV